MTEPSDIVGHKTFDTGERDANGMPIFRHEPLTRAEGEALLQAADKAKADRAAAMPDEKSAIKAMWEAHQRLKELGWRAAMYCPKDGSAFQVIEPGSTGIFECRYSGEWPKGSFDVYADNDVWPSHPILFKLYPKDQAEYDAKMAEAQARYADSTHDWFVNQWNFESCRTCGIVRRADRKNKICRGPSPIVCKGGETDGEKAMRD